MTVDLADGLYAVVRPTWAAGFIVRNGQIHECAPILRRRLHYWASVARPVDQPAATPTR